MVKISDKANALREVTIAAMHVFDLRPGGPRLYNLTDNQRAAADLAYAQLRAFEFGATNTEVDDASQWG